MFFISLGKGVQVAILDIRGITLHKSVQILAKADKSVVVKIYENAVQDAFNISEMVAQKLVSGIRYDKPKIWKMVNKQTKRHQKN
jgi:ribosomal protein S13